MAARFAKQFLAWGAYGCPMGNEQAGKMTAQCPLAVVQPPWD